VPSFRRQKNQAASHRMPPRYLDHSAPESRHLGSLLTIMIATIRNSWSELLTLGCVPHAATESKATAAPASVPKTEHFCTELPEFLCQRYLVTFMENRGVDYGYCLAPAHCPRSQPPGYHRCFAAEDASNGTARWRFRISAGVSVLWTYHPALRNTLSGVWQGALTSQESVRSYADASSADRSDG
jgi:hypothetical protein